jgi:ATP-dependent RNA helicase DDX54/DBP10
MEGAGKAGSFQAMGLEKDLLKGLSRMHYMAPTPVQRKALPIVLAGVDTVCMARTGSGKTCVFLLPMIQKLKAHNPNSGVRAIILSPTRELAVQSYKFAKDMAKFTDLRIVSIIGGDGIESQFEALSTHPDIIIATPGRLMHQIREVSTFKLKHVEYLVFDEADRLFEMGVRRYAIVILSWCYS